MKKEKKMLIDEGLEDYEDHKVMIDEEVFEAYDSYLMRNEDEDQNER